MHRAQTVWMVSRGDGARRLRGQRIFFGVQRATQGCHEADRGERLTVTRDGEPLAALLAPKEAAWWPAVAARSYNLSSLWGSHTFATY